MKLPKQDMWFILAAYNEEKQIKNTINSLKENGYFNIVVIDDGSSDNTYDIAEKQGVHVLKHSVNRGQGAALQTGVDFALSKDAKYIIHFDADGQHRIEDLPAMMKPLLNNEADICLGSRFINKDFKSNIPLSRQFYLKGGLWFTKLMTGLKLTDTHNGYRTMTAKSAKKLVITQDRMEHASEILELIARNKLRYKEVPVIIKYNEEVMSNSANNFSSAIKILIKTIYYKISK